MELSQFTVTGIPESKGDWREHHDGRYRVWKAEHGLDWRHHFNGHNGWILVAAAGWRVVTVREVYDGGGRYHRLPGMQVELRVYDTVRNVRHPEFDYKRYDTFDQAYDALWAAGLFGLFIYDRHADHLGLLDKAIRFEDAEQAAGRLGLTERQTGDEQHDYWVYDWQWLLDARAYAAQLKREQLAAGV